MAANTLNVVDTPSRELVATGFWITDIGYAAGDRHYQNYSRTRTDHLIMLTVAGEGWFRVADHSGSLAPGDLTLLPAGVDHGLGCGQSGRWDLLYAHFDGPATGPMLTWWPGLSGGRYVIPAPVEDTSRLILAAIAELQERRDAYGLAAAGYVLQAIRTAIIEARRASAPQRHTSHASAAQQYIDARLHESLTLEQIADHVHLSPAYLSRLFKQATGYSPMEYAIKQRINRAKDLLHQTDTPISTIARQTGYADAGYFARMFRSQTGMSPSTYRRHALTGQPKR